MSAGYDCPVSEEAACPPALSFHLHTESVREAPTCALNACSREGSAHHTLAGTEDTALEADGCSAPQREMLSDAATGWLRQKWSLAPSDETTHSAAAACLDLGLLRACVKLCTVLVTPWGPGHLAPHLRTQSMQSVVIRRSRGPWKRLDFDPNP